MEIYRLNLDEKELIQACKEGNIKLVRASIQFGVNIHADKDAPLRSASYYGYFDIVKYLIEQGANVRACDDFALRYAGLDGNLAIVKLLVAHGADPHVREDHVLYWAGEYNYPDIIEYILSLQPKIYWLTHQDKRIREIYKEYKNEL